VVIDPPYPEHQEHHQPESGDYREGDVIKKFDEVEVRKLFPEEHLFLSVNASVTIMARARQRDRPYEKAILAQAKLRV